MLSPNKTTAMWNLDLLWQYNYPDRLFPQYGLLINWMITMVFLKYQAWIIFYTIHVYYYSKALDDGKGY